MKRVKGLRVALLENVQAEEQDVIRKDATDANQLTHPEERVPSHLVPRR